MEDNKNLTEEAARRSRDERAGREALREKQAAEHAEAVAAKKREAMEAKMALKEKQMEASGAQKAWDDSVVIGKKFVDVPVKSAVPFWWAIGTWVLFVLICPIYKIGFLILAALVSALVFFIASKCVKKETRRVEVPVSSGNVEVDDMIRQINAVVEALEKDRAAVADVKPASAETMKSIELTAGKIRDLVTACPEELGKIRKFLNYYLPTTVKLCDKYAFTIGQGGTGTNIYETLTSVESALFQLDVSYKNLYDSLYSDDALDVTTDVQVLETMIKRDNLDK